MKPEQDGFYWLHKEGCEPTIGRWRAVDGWAIIGELIVELDPDDPVDQAELAKYTLGDRVR